MLINGDALTELKTLDSDSIDCIVTDPPYALTPEEYDPKKQFKGGFMNKKWDSALVSIDIWKECLRVMKPGAFAFILCAPRQDVLARQIVNLQDAGFKTNFTSLYHTFASGFPKAANVSKLVDKRFGAEREVIENKEHYRDIRSQTGYKYNTDDLSSTDNGMFKAGLSIERVLGGPVPKPAKALDGSYAGFQPKPALENILCCQKPLDIQSQITIIISQCLYWIHNIEWQSVKTVTNNSNHLQIVKRFIAQNGAMDKIVAEAKVTIGRVAKQHVPMATLKSILEELMEKQDTSWSIDLLWKITLVAVLSKTNKFTIEMATDQITELKILNSLLSANTQNNTMHQSETIRNGFKLNVSIVESILISVLTRCDIVNTTVQKNVSNLEQPKLNANNVADCSQSDQNISSGNESSVPKNATNRPAVEIVLTVMKPLSEKSYVDQALTNGKGITWLDSGRIPYQNDKDFNISNNKNDYWDEDNPKTKYIYGKYERTDNYTNQSGRFPANLLCQDDVLNDGKIYEGRLSDPSKNVAKSIFGTKTPYHTSEHGQKELGSFSRYFDLDKWFETTFPFAIIPKPSKREKNMGLDKWIPRKLESITGGRYNEYDGRKHAPVMTQNFHPTVKPIKLMCYLISLGSRHGDVILDPFAGSGTTLIAAKMLQRESIGIEISEEYCKIAEARLAVT